VLTVDIFRVNTLHAVGMTKIFPRELSQGMGIRRKKHGYESITGLIFWHSAEMGSPKMSADLYSMKPVLVFRPEMAA
jgi:hypothetical protein